MEGSDQVNEQSQTQPPETHTEQASLPSVPLSGSIILENTKYTARALGEGVLLRHSSRSRSSFWELRSELFFSSLGLDCH
jgi:hypothetical protein